jgi:hypothetical protein
MPKSQPLKDPAAFLKDLVSRRGESQQYATMFYGANLTFDPNEHSHSDTYADTLGFLQNLVQQDKKYRKLVSFLSHADVISETYRFKEYFGLTGVFAYINKDADSLRVTFCFPLVNASRFFLDVEILSHIALHWAKIARKDVESVRVFIDQAVLRWEDMEEENLLFTEFESD